jgi:transcriptional regulator with XRE-family HTH domain
MVKETLYVGLVKIEPTLIETLLLLRRRKGWTQAECAKKLSVSSRTLRAWEDGQNKPKPLTMKAIETFIQETK